MGKKGWIGAKKQYGDSTGQELKMAKSAGRQRID